MDTSPTREAQGMRIRVYVDAYCLGCQRATELVTLVQDNFPQADISSIDVQQETVLPGSLFALPTWYVDDRVWMLGNPTWEQLRTKILDGAG
jgi:hypothetical protein